MMKYIICYSLANLITLVTIAQNKFDITYNNGYGSKPTYTEFRANETITEAQAIKAFSFLKDSCNIAFNYSYGSCEDRAHAMALILKSRGIANRKIWNFDPYYISLFNAQHQLVAPDKSQLRQTVSWGFHVAPIVQVKKGNVVSVVVLDPALADSPVPIAKWLTLQQANNSYYTFADSEWFTFVTINGQSYNGQPVPKGFPTLLTGDFYKNEKENLTNMWVEEGLSVNSMALIIKNKIIDSPTAPQPKKATYMNLLTDIDALTNALNKKNNPAFTTEADGLEFEQFQSDFIQARNQWKQKLDKLR